MSNYQPYSEYKDSGIVWLGDIPSSWNLLPIKRLSKIYNGATPKSNEKQFWDGQISWVTPSDLSKNTSPYITEGARSITQQGYESCGTNLVPKDSIILSSRAPIGTLGIAVNFLSTNQGCKSLAVTKGFISKFLYYVLLSSTKQLNMLGKGTTFLELSSEELGLYKFVFPSEDEQQNIAKFLDHETAKIDTLIEKQQQLIKLLKEKRQAVISHAVTKGLNPDAPMKDSGVEWLGEVPEHWDVKRLKFACQFINQKVTIENQTVIALENIESWTGKFINTSSKYSGDEVEFETEDILFGKLRPYLAKVFFAKQSGIAFGDILVYRPSKAIKGKYCFYQMLNAAFISIVDSSTYGSKMPRASAEFINDMEILLPPSREQDKIISFIEENLVIFNRVESKATKAIDLMKERRTALISAAVTGKIDVRNWIVPNKESRRVKDEKELSL